MNWRIWVSTLVSVAALASITLPVSPVMADTTETECVAAGLSECVHLGSIAVGSPVYWEGAHVESSTMLWETCDIAAPCWHYKLTVPEGGSRLRVSLDYTDRESRFVYRIRPPGDSLPTQFDPIVDSYNDNNTTGWTTLEIAYPNGDTRGKGPVAGEYLISVAAVDVKDDTFRMRAILDGPPEDAPAAPAIPLLPNATVVPPFNFSFDSTLDAQSIEKSPTYGDLGLQQSCSEDEKSIDKATECLRFAAGGFNNGAGPLTIKWDAGTSTQGQATQTILLSDGTTTTSEELQEGHEGAGTFTFHPQHRHFHYEDAMKYRLFHAVSRTKNRPEIAENAAELIEIGQGMKTSYCMVDYFLEDWYSTDQQSPTEPNAAQANCGSVRNRPVVHAFDAINNGRVSTEYRGSIGWSKGWGDVYPYWRQGQYVEFKDAPGDGYYVVQVSFDELDHLLESNEEDNVAYGFIHITGYGTKEWNIEVLERGYGRSPWDENKQVIGIEERTWI